MGAIKERLQRENSRIMELIEQAELEEAREYARDREWMGESRPPLHEMPPELRRRLNDYYDQIVEALTPGDRGIRDRDAALDICRRLEDEVLQIPTI